MKSKVQFFECYDYNEELYLIEMIINDSSNNIDWSEFVVPESNLPEKDWQCAFLEQYLNLDGTEKICELYDEPQEAVCPCRIAFFIYKYDTQEKKIITPYGTFSFENSIPMPERLLKCIEFEDEEDEDDED
ncbi:MAG: hypothetical protein K2L70_06460 [Clostridia bacterium]|nr:hypothetical protein [Clostridia bacterium]